MVPTPYSTGTVTVTQNSTSVTGSGTTWTSAHIGQQFIVGGQAPFYTISAVPSATSLTLDRVYGGTSGAGLTYTIVQVYLVAPSDLLRLDSVIDPDNFWRLNLNWTQEALDRIDAQRSHTSSGSTSRILATAPFSSAGLLRYELWPRPASAKSYPFRYTKRIADLSAASDTPIFPIRGDALRYGALAQLTMWKNSANPLYDLTLHREYEALFQGEINFLERQDQEIRQDSVVYEDHFMFPYAPMDSRFWQSHAPF